MATLPLDLHDLLREVGGRPEPGPGAPEGTRIGHVHLQVADLQASEEFYCGILGFEVTVRSYPGALFVSAGGYHHHLGLNTWNTRNNHPRAAGTVGLEHFEIVLPDEAELERVDRQVRSAAIAIERTTRGAVTTDPSGNRLLLRTP
jgi:catechol 2,3-dioxygenase